jgi:ABC-2 type transport system ATP-binding protein
MQLPGGRRRLAAVTGAVALVLAGGFGWKAATAPPSIHSTDQRIEVVDGPADDQHVSLDTSFFVPPGQGRHPAILLAHGFGGSKDEVRSEAISLARHGYAVLTWSARGFGASTGQIGLDSPDYEVKDTEQLITWLARRPQVQLDGPNDPRVGITGESYGGGISLMTAAYDHRVDAIVPRITWNDLADALFPEGTGQGARTGVFKKLWAGIFFTGANNRKVSQGPCGRFLPALCTMYQQVATGGLPTDQAVQTLRRSSPSSVADRIKAPTLLIQGQSDSLFPLDQADANAEAIRRNGTPVSMLWYQGGHDGGDPETGRTNGLTRAWFDRYLKHDNTNVPAFTVTRSGGFDSSNQSFTIQAATDRSYPGLSASPHTLRLSGGTKIINNPAGGTPASISALPGLGDLNGLGSLAGLAGNAGGSRDGGASGGGLGGSTTLDMPGQYASFDSPPLKRPLQLTGSPRVRIRVSAGAPDQDVTLFAKLYDVAPDGQAAPARLIAEPLRVVRPGPGGAEATINLPAMDYRFASGHRVRLVIDSTDMGFATSPLPATYRVSVVSPLSVPTVPGLHTPAGSVPAWTWILPLVAAGLAAAIILAGRGRGGSRPYDPELDDVPLQITGLTKAYSNGRRAVDDLSFRVEQGQVLGLLGPNGAGKTTTLRMLMGLIHPDGGEIRIFGHRVVPGATVLSRLGSFVEGPGFLPHLSGRDNLELYWKATGRPQVDSHMDEALKVADLGTALERPVRTYSQGMRQRLAIAQAMLGLPDLLVLDEPTNGLDPPQIRAMREVLVKYAESGRTVIVSSHLLAEVEQTCTHVVVMSSGRRIAAGGVAEIVGEQHRLEDAFLAIIEENA